MKAKKPDYYVILGVTRDATQEEIKRAYFEAAQHLHPDKNKRVGETEIFLDVQQAYETLSNAKRRAKYDTTLPPEEKHSLPVEIKVSYSRPNLVRMNESQIVYVFLEIKPGTTKEQIPIPPLNLCLVLDHSTSMKGEKIDVLKDAASQVLRGLRPQDILSVVSFSDRAEVIIPASYQSDKSKLQSRIQMLQPSGATELFQGLKKGVDEVERNSGRSYVSHVILMTDGHTYGDEQKCLDLAKQASDLNIGISAMGIGKEWKDAFLDELASVTGGSSKYIAQPQDIQRFLVEKFESLARTFAEDIVLNFTSTEGVDLSYAFRSQPEVGLLPIASPIHLGPVLQDTKLSVLFEFRVNPSLTKQDVVKLIKGTLKLSVAGMSTPPKPLPIEFSREVKNEAGTDSPPPLIVQALGKLTLYRLQDKARLEVESGQFELAARHLNHLATNLLTQGERSLAKTVLIEARNVEQLQNFSEEGRRAIKYGTRSLVMPESKDQRV